MKKKNISGGKRNQANSSGRFRIKVLKFFLKLFLAGIAFLAVFLSLVYIGLFGRIPAEEELAKIRNFDASEVYSADGKMIGKYYIENRRNIENNNISEHVINALVATEDSRFFEHKGLDYISMGRVLVHSVLMGDKAQGGGSTISQQLAKNLYPRRDYKFLSLPVNKAREMFTAARLEGIYTKSEILNLYLNTVPFGENIYGIEVAANRFFNKSSSQLKPHEAATIIGMLAANTLYNPRLHPNRSVERRNTVLNRMVTQGFLTEKQGEKYRELPLELNYRVLDKNNGPAPYFMEVVRRSAEKTLEELYGDSINLYRDGLRIYTTLNAQLQEFANDAVYNHMVRLQNDFDTHWKNRKPWEGHPEIFVSALKNSSRYQALKKKGKSETEIMEVMETPVSTVILEDGEEIKIEMSPADSVAWAISQLHAGFLAVNPSDGAILAWVGERILSFFLTTMFYLNVRWAVPSSHLFMPLPLKKVTNLVIISAMKDVFIVSMMIGPLPIVTGSMRDITLCRGH